jgi:ribosomal protein S27AE
MVRNDFSRIISTLCEYYERREPKNAALEAWFARCKHIPIEPLDYIAQKIMENHETFPKNLPSAMRDTFTEWLQANPDKRAVKTFTNCPDCEDGLIFTTKHQEKLKVKYKYVFSCGKCRQSEFRQYPTAMLFDLISDGHKPRKWTERKSYYAKPTTVEELAAKVNFKPMPYMKEFNA